MSVEMVGKESAEKKKASVGTGGVSSWAAEGT